MEEKLKLLLTPDEHRIFRKLSSPAKIQDYLENLRINFEPGGDMLQSPRRVLETQEAHCIEAALLAAAALWYHGDKPLLLDLRTGAGDFDHVVALFRRHGRWGAISKTNHAVLRWREPVYLTVRELAMSYFHEYTDDSGAKTLRDYSSPFDLRRYRKTGWVTSPEDLWYIAEDLDDSRHFPVAPAVNMKNMRKIDPLEDKAGDIVQFKAPKK